MFRTKLTQRASSAYERILHFAHTMHKALGAHGGKLISSGAVLCERVHLAGERTAHKKTTI